MGLEFTDICHAYDGQTVLNGVSFLAPRGQITCLVGASGSGKTTLLRLAAGLLKIQDGSLSLDNELLADATNSPPPEARQCGLVFQEGALFPHLTVRSNIAFGLRGHSDPASRTGELLELIGLTDLADRYPDTLSGGQQQRVALARALAPNPQTLLMDEPFANLDARLRRELRQEVREVLTAQDVVSILVTHDPEEAMEMADNIIYLEDGRIIQSGAPRQFLHAPQTPAIARIFSRANVFSAEIVGRELVSDAGRWPIECLANPPHDTIDGSTLLQFSVPPSQLVMTPSDDESDLACEIVDTRYIGQCIRVILRSGNGELIVVETDCDPALDRHSRVHLSARAGQCLAYSNGLLVPFQCDVTREPSSASSPSRSSSTPNTSNIIEPTTA